ncbi:glycosyltransferase family 90 protein [Aulographum hederae CBS 113979]|uniref:Glycosyltransferase family 90 protein n=1 Tax=Aulographum hederae CBS 113979 TaxID=1176131 RepID=A0A6G1HG97_9PEZI|nr:glycosyltransferase family 90 protein [Aulographum hederae CBS 113979]
MDWHQILILWGLIASIAYLSTTYDTSFAFDRPVPSAIIILAACGASIIAGERLWPIALHSSPDFTPIPLTERRFSHSRQSSGASVLSVDGTPANGPTSRLRQARIFFLALLLCVCLRVEVLHRVTLNTQCTVHGLQAFLPLVLAIEDYFLNQRSRTVGLPDGKLVGFLAVFRDRVKRSRFTNLGTSLLLGCSSLLGSVLDVTPRSTIICAATLRFIHDIPLLQFSGFILDGLLLIIIVRLAGLHTHNTNRSPRVLGWCLVLSSLVLLAAGGIAFLSLPDERYWTKNVPVAYYASILKFSLAVCVTVQFAIRSVYKCGVLRSAMLCVAAASLTLGFFSAWNYVTSLGQLSGFKIMLSSVAIIISLVIYMMPESTSRTNDLSTKSTLTNSLPTLPIWILAPLLAIVLAQGTLWYHSGLHITEHPIDKLIRHGDTLHETWTKQAGTGSSLAETVKAYVVRYGRHPPPSFDKWYKFAAKRSSVVFNDFDSIEDDLKPFWALSPRELRSRTTWEISRPGNGVASISIRGGKASIGPYTPDTHRWMLEGTMHMMKDFVNILPDMDLAMNINDECRVSVPHEDITWLENIGRARASQRSEHAVSHFSEKRGATWPELHQQDDTERVGRPRFQSMFYDYGSVACPPSSPARTARIWNRKSLCLSCSRPHSDGHFVSDWHLAGSICHQPDLADLHGFYLSPASFTGTRKLRPVFSQSKADGFADILYPSSWNYMNKVEYAPIPQNPDVPFQKKSKTIFWRGTTSEGVSSNSGTWKGMTRQRLVHLANHATSPQTLLLPSGSNNFKYTPISPQDLKSRLTPTLVDISLVGDIARCGGRDCDDQNLEFGPRPPYTDFQTHWSNAYLLDTDGAGFSGRFLPFLQSRSLPFKAALFREWYDDRLVAWKHFVPIDIRLHGLWSTLVYFAGWDGGKWQGHQKEAEKIAEAGREWVGKVVRKEDMEIYLFRLLLEWGRLTDENREVLGFTMEGVKERGDEDDEMAEIATEMEKEEFVSRRSRL